MKKFVTTYELDGVLYSGIVDAIDREHGQLICDERHFGETVEGPLLLSITGIDDRKADEMLKRFADENPEPPDFS